MVIETRGGSQLQINLSLKDLDLSGLNLVELLEGADSITSKVDTIIDGVLAGIKLTREHFIACHMVITEEGATLVIFLNNNKVNLPPFRKIIDLKDALVELSDVVESECEGVFSFSDIEDVISLSVRLKGVTDYKNSLYARDKDYFLILDNVTEIESSDKLPYIILDYGDASAETINSIRSSSKVICDTNALGFLYEKFQYELS